MKKSKKNQTLLILLLLVIQGMASVKAQMRMGGTTEPEPNAILDLNANNTDNGKKGLLLPRVALTATTNANPLTEHVKGMYVYNTATAKDVLPGVYYNDGTKWVRSGSESNENSEQKWFYMPSIVIDVTTSGTFTRNLYLEYKKQFADIDDASTPPNSPTPGTELVKSDSNAPNPFNKIYAANELYFYVTGYDTTVFSNLSITPAGVLTYTVHAENVTDATYMNIVFVIK